MHSTTTESIRRGRAVLRPCPTCLTRHGRRKCARLPSYAGSLAGSIREEPATPTLQVRAAKTQPAPRPPTGLQRSPGAVSRDRDLHDAPIGTRRRSRGLSRMPHMPDTPQPTGIAPNGASCMIRDPPPRRRPAPTHLQVPAVKKPIRPTTTADPSDRPPGTDARRNRPHGCRAQRGPSPTPIPSFSTLASSRPVNSDSLGHGPSFSTLAGGAGSSADLLGQPPAHARSLARRAPSASAPSFAQQMSGSIAPKPDQVPKPQSLPPITRSAPTIRAYVSSRWATSSGCSM